MDTIFVAGAWGSGTTAVAGAVHALGVTTFEPLLQLNDPKTPVSYELVPFRQIILRYVDERTLRYKDKNFAQLAQDLKQLKSQLEAGAFGPWLQPEKPRLVLKLPAALAVLPPVIEAFDPKLVFVQRSLADVERSRVRRKWPEVFGGKGADVLLTKAFADLLQLERSFLSIGYRELIADPEYALKRICAFCDLEDLSPRIPEAAKFVRR